MYNRSKAVEELKGSLKDLDISFTSYQTEDMYDACLVVRGCNRNCVSAKEFSNCRRLFTAVCKEDFFNIKNELCAMVK